MLGLCPWPGTVNAGNATHDSASHNMARDLLIVFIHPSSTARCPICHAAAPRLRRLPRAPLTCQGRSHVSLQRYALSGRLVSPPSAPSAPFPGRVFVDHLGLSRTAQSANGAQLARSLRSWRRPNAACGAIKAAPVAYHFTNLREQMQDERI